ncbi:NO-inducible flavohemoprotein [Paracoccus onubensis]|uniref:nitric oxide dioxygenase n=1 Tax=Paracoccus onubensis TaxID=1675788 RepID=A0A418T848_9RHOB|nr:NO-inducible flavohemoprotein [Paracoccus onubensis]RJE89357.1 NO-inducible flavohemoprotein [Paracoccus onubensis]
MSNHLSAETIAVVKATVPAIAEHGATITEVMYRRLFEDEHIARLFNQANQKSGTQRFALANAVLAYAQNIDNPGALASAVERIAQKHVGYAILPEHYPYVATALLGAIEEVLGEAATPEILAAWGEAYWFLADILKGREAGIRKEIDAQTGGWIGWRHFAITERRAESDQIMSFTLRPEDGAPVIRHRPGQYLTLRFDMAGLKGVIRNYSISCGPNNDHYRITVKREPEGEASGFLHDRAEIGSIFELTAPAGDFYLREVPDRPVVLLSGGVGLTPMVSMLEEIADKHKALPAYFIHGTTDRHSHALAAHIRQLARRHGNTEIATFYERMEPADAAYEGYISVDWLKSELPLNEADIFLCGPRPFLRHYVSSLIGANVSPDRIHYEFFGPTDEILAA